MVLDHLCHGVLNLRLVGHDQLFLLIIRVVVDGIALSFSTNYWIFALIEEFSLTGLLHFHPYLGRCFSLYI